MVPDHVPSFHQFADNVGTLLYVAPDEEKCSMNVVPGQDFQQALSVRIVRTIIVSQGQLLRSAAQVR